MFHNSFFSITPLERETMKNSASVFEPLKELQEPQRHEYPNINLLTMDQLRVELSKMQQENRGLSGRNVELARRVKTAEELVESYEKVVSNRSGTAVHKPGATVYIGPDKAEAKVLCVTIGVDGTVYSVAYWSKGVRHSVRVMADEVSDERPFLKP